MLTGEPSSIFSWDFDVYDAAGSVVAAIDQQWFAERATVKVLGQPYALYREGWLSGAFVLQDQQGRRIASAEKTSAMTRSFIVWADGRTFELEGVFLHRAMRLYEHGREVGAGGELARRERLAEARRTGGAVDR